MEGRKAVVLGGNGLTGRELVRQLAAHGAWNEVHIIGRNNPGFGNPNIHFHQVDMEHIAQHAGLFKVTDVFCCLGTTIKKAGNQENFRKVDVDMIVNSARAAEQYARQFIMISSIGADASSRNFYLKTKGETEQAVLALNIPAIHILRPSLLLGDRAEKRGGEKMAIVIMKILNPLMIGPLRKYRGIQASKVARIMVSLALQEQPGKHIHKDLENLEDWKKEEGRSANDFPIAIGRQ